MENGVIPGGLPEAFVDEVFRLANLRLSNKITADEWEPAIKKLIGEK